MLRLPCLRGFPSRYISVRRAAHGSSDSPRAASISSSIWSQFKTFPLKSARVVELFSRYFACIQCRQVRKKQSSAG